VAVVPCLVLLVFIYRLDRYAPEKPRWILVALALGAAAFLPALAVGALVRGGRLGEPTLAAVLARDFLVVAPLEETLKLSVLVGFAAYRRFFDEPLDAMIYAWTIALGFAACENVVYLTSRADAFVWRALFSTPSHLLFAGLWGWALGKWRTIDGRALRVVLLGVMLLQAIAAHGLYNALWDLGTLPPGSLPGAVVVPPWLVVAAVSALLCILLAINALYYRGHVRASPYRFSLLPHGVQTLRRGMVDYTWRRWVHALWLTTLFALSVGIVLAVSRLASASYALAAGPGGMERLVDGCTVVQPGALSASAAAALAALSFAFLLLGVIYGRFSRSGASALTLLIPGTASLTALMLVVGLAPRLLGTWLVGLSAEELSAPCGLTFRRAAQSFLLYSSYVVLGIGFAGGWLGRRWRRGGIARLSGSPP
jgi:RsiW-degrading membrane proteinase PrsW (M82 family)